ncbi:MAG: LssY C-terminal domain-containing protein [Luteolibacter sp.]|uniref:LssY C-terminal domain-containing protein n=1 Tax=Luteolibacter sp. TaxID=1962973 RepID=UPI003266B2AD
MSDHASHPRRRASHWGKIVLVLLAIYLLIAYIVMPQLDRRKVHRHPDLEAGEHLTRTGTGLPGDPLDISLVGSEADVVLALHAAGWDPADPLSFDSSVRIAVDTVFNKPDPNAPVSTLYLFGRKEDLAFEKPVGHSPKERHHVRLWKSKEPKDGRPLWLGSATHDIGVELSRTTGQVTHHIAADVDTERDMLISELSAAKHVLETTWIDGYQTVLQGRNGGGDPWHTDGRLPVVKLTETQP